MMSRGGASTYLRWVVSLVICSMNANLSYGWFCEKHRIVRGDWTHFLIQCGDISPRHQYIFHRNLRLSSSSCFFYPPWGWKRRRGTLLHFVHPLSLSRMTNEHDDEEEEEEEQTVKYAEDDALWSKDSSRCHPVTQHPPSLPAGTSNSGSNDTMTRRATTTNTTIAPNMDGGKTFIDEETSFRPVLGRLLWLNRLGDAWNQAVYIVAGWILVSSIILRLNGLTYWWQNNQFTITTLEQRQFQEEVLHRTFQRNRVIKNNPW